MITLSETIQAETPQCSLCKHVSKKEFKCKAFPKEIPVKILTGEIDHTKPYPGDNGIQFERAEQK